MFYKTKKLFLFLTIQCVATLFFIPRVYPADSGEPAGIKEILEQANESISTNPENALEAFHKAYELAEDSGNEELMAESAQGIGEVYFKMRNFDQAINYLRISEQLNISTGESENRIIVNYLLGRSYNKLDKYNEAIFAFENAISFAKVLKDTSFLMQSMLRLGTVYQNKNQYPKSLEINYDLLNLVEKSNNLHLKAEVEINMGLIYKALDNQKESIRYFLSALEHKKEIADSVGIAHVYLNLGNVYRDHQDYAEAMELYSMAQGFAPKNTNHELWYYIPVNRGIALFEQNDFQSAKDNYQIALATAKTMKSPSKLALTYSRLAQSEIQDKNYNSAKKLLTQALEIAQEINSLETEQWVYFMFYKLYNKQLEFEKALAYYQKHTEVKNRMFDSESDRAISELKFQYETEKKEREIEELKNQNLLQQLENTHLKNSRTLWTFIAILAIFAALPGIMVNWYKRKSNRIIKSKNTELNQVIKRLEDSLKTKDKLFSIIAHDLKSPFNSIIGFSELLVRQHSAMDKEKIIKYSEAIYRSSRNTFELVNNLLEWSRLQLGQISVDNKPEAIKPIIDKEIKLIEEAAARKEITIDNHTKITDIALIDELVFPIIARNLLTNAIKFSEQKTTITVSSLDQPDTIKVLFKDQGIGIPEEKRNTLFNFNKNSSTPGTQGEKGTGIGLALTHELVELLGGKIEVQSQPGNTVFAITLKKPAS